MYDLIIHYYMPNNYTLCVLPHCSGDIMQWQTVPCKGPAPLPRSLHTAVMVNNKMFVFGGWVPVLGRDEGHLIFETDWKCSNSLACLNTGE